MQGRISIVGRLLVYASLVAFLGFYLVGMGWPHGAARTALKGAAVGLLAVLAWVEGEGDTRRFLTAIMALGALGDMVLEWSLEVGAACFLAGHFVAIVFYRRNRRAALSQSQRALALLVLVMVPVIAWELPWNRSTAPLTALYALGLSAMAASAWASRFPRYMTGIGAMLFVVSDLLIFARSGPMQASALPGLLIWPLYFLGQFMIALGVLRERFTPPVG